MLSNIHSLCLSIYLCLSVSNTTHLHTLIHTRIYIYSFQMCGQMFHKLLMIIFFSRTYHNMIMMRWFVKPCSYSTITSQLTGHCLAGLFRHRYVMQININTNINSVCKWYLVITLYKMKYCL